MAVSAKKAFGNIGNAALAYTGSVGTWGPLVLTAAISAYASAISMRSVGMLEVISRLDTPVLAGMGASLLFGTAMAVAGYNRVIPGTEAKQKSKLAHAFNFVSVSVGAAAATLSALVFHDVFTQPHISPNPNADLLYSGLVVAAGLGLFTAGYNRMFGKTQATAPAATSPAVS